MSTADAVVRAAQALAAISGLAGAYGALCWYRGAQSRGFWIALRAGQAAALVLALAAGALWVAGRRATDDLFYLYAVLPPAIGFVAEQLRILAAEQVLSARGLTAAAEVGELPAPEQRAVVEAILARELGVMAASALAVCFLALRAAATAHGFR